MPRSVHRGVALVRRGAARVWRSAALAALLLLPAATATAATPWGPLRRPSIAEGARAYLGPAPRYTRALGLWQSHTLAFPLPKADGEPVRTDPFGDGSQVVVHFENYDDGDWCYPVPGARVTSDFGWRGNRGHAGTDIKTFGEDRICAAFEGVVVSSDNSLSGYGNCIVIAHSNGIATLYSHNLRNMVQAGEHVTAGQVIALIGRSGHATGDHLHFECRVQGVPFNSALVFDHEKCRLRGVPLVLLRSGAAYELR